MRLGKDRIHSSHFALTCSKKNNLQGENACPNSLNKAIILLYEVLFSELLKKYIFCNKTFNKKKLRKPDDLLKILGSC